MSVVRETEFSVESDFSTSQNRTIARIWKDDFYSSLQNAMDHLLMSIKKIDN